VGMSNRETFLMLSSWAVLGVGWFCMLVALG
jgi:hypothetical protein